MTFINTIVDKTLCYGVKSPDTELYDLGFNDVFVPSDSVEDILHILCEIRLIWKNGTKRIDCYDGNTSSKDFNDGVNNIIGKKVKRVSLSDKNDLWLDFGDFWMILVTLEDDEESWRFFKSDGLSPHLVVSASWVRFDD